MTRTLLTACTIFIFVVGHAQFKEGRIVYERTSQISFRAPGMNDDVARTRTDKFELLYTLEHSLWQRIAEDEEEEQIGEGGGMRIRMMVGGQNDIVYHNFKEAKRTESREIFDRTFIIEDSVRKLNWKMSEEIKDILGYKARKATAQRIGQRTAMQMHNGEPQRQIVPDTSNITIWYTDAIPVPGGPEFQGQIPGLILEVDVNNGRTTYKAIEISPKVETASIKAPKGKKKYTTEEFNKERDALMEEMRQNGGGNRRIIMN
jgi:GLPGLI family protein